jgi:hypothetical protein
MIMTVPKQKGTCTVQNFRTETPHLHQNNLKCQMLNICNIQESQQSLLAHMHARSAGSLFISCKLCCVARMQQITWTVQKLLLRAHVLLLSGVHTTCHDDSRPYVGCGAQHDMALMLCKDPALCQARLLIRLDTLNTRSYTS